MYEEHVMAPNLLQPAPNKYLNDLQKQGFSAKQERTSYRLWHQSSGQSQFDIQPTNPQADIVATGRCEYWITDVDLMKHQGNDTESPSDDPILLEVYTATVAYIYNVDRKCKGVLIPERLNILQRAFEMAKYSGLHNNIHPPPMRLALELVGLITRKDIATSRHASQKI